MVSALAAQAILLRIQGRREQRAYERSMRAERRSRLLREYATIDAAALDLFRLARGEYDLLKQHQAGASRWWIVRRFRQPISFPQALEWKKSADELVQRLQERIIELKRSVSLARLDSQVLDLNRWDELVSALGDFNECFRAIVPPNVLRAGAVEEMGQMLGNIRRLYDDLFLAMRSELDRLESELDTLESEVEDR